MALADAETAAAVAEVLADHQPEAAKPTKLDLHQAVQEHKHAAFQMSMLTSRTELKILVCQLPNGLILRCIGRKQLAPGELIVRGDKYC